MSVVTPAALPDAAVIRQGVTLTSLSVHIGDSVLRLRAPLWWRIGFGMSLFLLAVLIFSCTWLFVNGIGVWGVDIPVAWGLAIAEYVWWIARARGGIILSALFYLPVSLGRSAISRIAESMMLSAAAAAGIMP